MGVSSSKRLGQADLVSRLASERQASRRQVAAALPRRRHRGPARRLRPGRRRTYDDDKAAAVIKRALQQKPDAGTHWSTRTRGERKASARARSSSWFGPAMRNLTSRTAPTASAVGGRRGCVRTWRTIVGKVFEVAGRCPQAGPGPVTNAAHRSISTRRCSNRSLRA